MTTPDWRALSTEGNSWRKIMMLRPACAARLNGPRRLGDESDWRTILPRRTKIRRGASPGFAAARRSRARDFGFRNFGVAGTSTATTPGWLKSDQIRSLSRDVLR